MAKSKSIAVITFSTRAIRVGPEVAAVVKEILEKDTSSGVQLASVDVADFKLPVFDEPVIPAHVPAKASYVHDHTKRWSAEIQRHDAYVCVIPEYNHGIAGATKNAVDFICSEWAGKPALIVSYGIMGGKTASEQLCKTLAGVSLRVAPTRPALSFAGGVGPELESAMLQGQLGPETRKEWTEKESAGILKAFGELKDLLAEEKTE